MKRSPQSRLGLAGGIGLVSIGVALIAVATVGGATPDRSGGIRGSKHDWSAEEWSGGDTCKACHVPHRDELPKVGLWEKRESTLGRSFPTRSPKTPSALTRACLICHDGNSASSIAAQAGAESARTKLGRFGHRSGDHPVGVKYPNSRKFRPRTAVTAGGVIRLYDGKVECATCHDPHNSADQPAMLVMPNDESQLCASCHKI